MVAVEFFSCRLVFFRAGACWRVLECAGACCCFGERAVIDYSKTDMLINAGKYTYVNTVIHIDQFKIRLYSVKHYLLFQNVNRHKNHQLKTSDATMATMKNEPHPP